MDHMSSDSSHGLPGRFLSCGACVGTAADIRMVILFWSCLHVAEDHWTRELAPYFWVCTAIISHTRGEGDDTSRSTEAGDWCSPAVRAIPQPALSPQELRV